MGFKGANRKSLHIALVFTALQTQVLKVCLKKQKENTLLLP